MFSTPARSELKSAENHRAFTSPDMGGNIWCIVNRRILNPELLRGGHPRHPARPACAVRPRTAARGPRERTCMRLRRSAGRPAREVCGDSSYLVHPDSGRPRKARRRGIADHHTLGRTPERTSTYIVDSMAAPSRCAPMRASDTRR
mgnify:CR=1 FL=1